MLSLSITPFLLAGFSAPELQDTPAPRQDQDLERMVEDMEIMRRIIDTKLVAKRVAYGVYAQDPLSSNRRAVPFLSDVPLLSDQFQDSEKGTEDDILNGKSEDAQRAAAMQAFGLLANQQAKAKTNSRAFYVPGVGVFFSFDVTVRVKWTETPRDPEHEAAKENDLWDQVRDQVRSGTRGDNPFNRILEQQARRDANRKRTEGKVASWDEQAIDELRSTVLEVIAQHGHRMERLGVQDQIVVVLKVSPANPTHVYSRDAFLHALNSGKLAPLHLVLRVPRRLVTEFDAKRIDFKGFLKSAAKTRY